MKGNDSADVDMLTNVRSMANCNCAISMNLFNEEGSNHAWTKFVYVRVLNEDVLANNVIHPASFGIGA